MVAHSFGSIVTGCGLADRGLQVTDVVVAGSPGMTVDELRELHLDQSHFFSEQAPGDAIAELGAFGAPPASPTFGGTRMSTNAPEHPRVGALAATSSRLRGLENMADVVTGQYDDILRHRRLPRDRRGPGGWALRCRRPRSARPAPLPGTGLPGARELVPPGRPRGERDGQLGLRGLERGRAGPAVVPPTASAPCRTRTRMRMRMRTRTRAQRRMPVRARVPTRGRPSVNPADPAGGRSVGCRSAGRADGDVVVAVLVEHGNVGRCSARPRLKCFPQ